MKKSTSGNNCNFFSTTTSINNTTTALDVLNLQQNPHFSSFELRDAYFSAAKLCHPDANKNSNRSKNNHEEECTLKFLQITEAYEYLQNNRSVSSNTSRTRKKNHNHDDDIIIHQSDEEQYRRSCRECLGLDAETVEESKKCPLFRQWLQGKTDAAFHWNRFLMVNGGLAPMLSQKHTIYKLSEGSGPSSGYGSSSLIGGMKRRRRRNDR